MSHLTLRQCCARCDFETDELNPALACPDCGGLLEVVIPPPTLRGAALRAALGFASHPSGVWRFRELLLPSVLDHQIVSHPEGNTPLLHRAAIDRWSGVEGVTLKHEGHNPTGSFKDRGMTVGITQAKRIGARAVACASTGNTSASLASYAAHAGIPALVFIPNGQVALGKLTQSLAYGARTLVVDGDFDACLKLATESSHELGVYLLNSVNPFRVEGQKSIVFELLAQRHWEVPDWLVLPAGNLGNTAAFGKALREALAWGLIDRLPRLVAVQASGAAPFAAAFERGFDQLVPVPAQTLATAIKIGAPASYHRAVAAIRETNGLVLQVSDAEILEAKAMIDAAGVGCEPASAATLAGIRQLSQRGLVTKGQAVVGVLTGHILKDPGALQEMHRDRPDRPGWSNPPMTIPPTVAAVRQILDSIGVAYRPK